MRYLLSTLLLFGLAACKEEPHTEGGPRPVVSEIVGHEAGLQPIYIGTVTARSETDLGFPISGTLIARPVQEGDVVGQGAPLGRVDPKDLDAALRAAEAGIEVAQARLHSAEDSAERVNRLVAKGVDTAASAQAARASLVAAEAALTQAQAVLDQAKESRGLADLTAPHEGVVTEVYSEPGAAVSAGQPVVRLATIGEREAVIDLSEQDAAGLAPGAEFLVRLEVAPQIATDARLRLIDPVADSATRTRRLHLTLSPATADAFRFGALVRVEPYTETQAQLTLPASAILTDPPAVWIVSPGDRRVERVPVTLGQELGDRVVVVAGLGDGQEVVVKGVNSIEDGQQVGSRATE